MRLLGIKLELGHLAAGDLGVQGEDARLAGARHRHVEQARAFLEVVPLLLIAYGEPGLRHGTRGAHVVHQVRCEPRSGTGVEAGETLLHLGCGNPAPVR